MYVGFIPALASAFCQGDSMIDARERGFNLARFCLRLCNGAGCVIRRTWRRLKERSPLPSQ